MITKETGILAPIVENIPPLLTARRQWTVWRPEQRRGKLEKVPYSVEVGVRTDANDSLSWITFEDAVEAYRSSGGFYAGIGFCLASCDPYVLIDLDHCRDASTGHTEPWAQRVIDRVQNGYLEVSASQEGVHVIIEARLRGGKTQKKIGQGKIEMYAQNRFVALTGVAL